MTLDKLLNLYVPQLPVLQNTDNKKISISKSYYEDNICKALSIVSGMQEALYMLD